MLNFNPDAIACIYHLILCRIKNTAYIPICCPGVVRGGRGQPRADDPGRDECALLGDEPAAAVPRQRRPHHPALLAALPLCQHVDLQPDRHLGIPEARRGTVQLLHAQV